MDKTTLPGLIFALVCLLGGAMMEGTEPGKLVTLPAFVIVIGGTIGAALISFPLATAIAIPKLFQIAIKDAPHDLAHVVETFVKLADRARREGLLALPGVAGLIVAIGITADSFVVFFERLRDELREGRSVRSAVRHAWLLGRKEPTLVDVVKTVIDSMGDAYPELRAREQHLLKTTRVEEQSFLDTIEGGLARFDQLASEPKLFGQLGFRGAAAGGEHEQHGVVAGFQAALDERHEQRLMCELPGLDQPIKG